MKKLKLIFILVSLVVTVLSVFPTNSARAQQEKPSQALTVSPLIIEKQLEAGSATSFNVTVRNDSDAPLRFMNYINDFETSDKDDEQGVPKLIFDEREPHSHSVRPFIQAVPEFILQSKQSKVITYTLDIPQSTVAGGYYGSIRFTALPVDTANQVDLQASIGNLLFVQVGGAEAKETMALLDYFTSNLSFSKQWFFWNTPVQINEWVKNDGNTFLRPKGQIEIYNIFGAKVGEVKVNEQEGSEKPKIVLPGSTRKFYQRFESPWMIGPYTAKLLLFYGNAQQTTVDKQLVFWVIPWWLIVLIIVIIVVIILLRKGAKRYKRNIIREANKQKK